MKLVDKNREDAIRKRIRRLVDERNVAVSAIALKSGVEQGTVKALYAQEGVKKQRISDVTATKVEHGLDEQEKALGMVKRCCKCGKTLPVGRFGMNKTKRDGLQSECKECLNAIIAESRRRNKDKKKEKHMNNNTEKAMTAEIVRKVKAEDKPDVESKFMAPYFAISVKQLDEVRSGSWDSLLLTPKVPKRADSVLEAVELLRGEVAGLRREVEAVMVELGIEIGNEEDDDGDA